jgi:hypothetical protein
MCAAEDSRIQARILSLSPDAWRVEATRLIRQSHPNRIASTIAFVRRMDELRAAPRVAPASPNLPEPKSELDLDFATWKDMVEDPAKYGDDIIEWLELDEKLRVSPKRWRVEAYWLCKEQEAVEEKKRKEEAIESLRAPYKALYSQIAKQAAARGMDRWIRSDINRFLARIHGAATKIQAAVRGHQTRSSLSYLNCAMCLAHRICPLESQVGMICRDCGAQGPYEDITGPVSDPWNWARSDLIDWTRQGQCECEECVDNYVHEHPEEYKCVYCGVGCHPAVNVYGPEGWMCVPCSQYEEEEEMTRCRGCGSWYPEDAMDSCTGYGHYCSRKCGPAGEANDWFDRY